MSAWWYLALWPITGLVRLLLEYVSSRKTFKRKNRTTVSFKIIAIAIVWPFF